jgi:3-mercaptopyruvate sulfurtransferase SseA
MKKIAIELLIIVAVSAIISILYNLASDRPLPWIMVPMEEKSISDYTLYDLGYVAKLPDLDSTLVYRQMAELKDDPDFQLIDARRPENYAKEKIGDAINIFPLYETEDEEMEYFEKLFSLPENVAIVVYCDGGECDLSHHVAKELLDLERPRVFLYWGGWEDWKKKTKNNK